MIQFKEKKAMKKREGSYLSKHKRVKTDKNQFLR